MVSPEASADDKRIWALWAVTAHCSAIPTIGGVLGLVDSGDGAVLAVEAGEGVVVAAVVGWTAAIAAADDAALVGGAGDATDPFADFTVAVGAEPELPTGEGWLGAAWEAGTDGTDGAGVGVVVGEAGPARLDVPVVPPPLAGPAFSVTTDGAGTVATGSKAAFTRAAFGACAAVSAVALDGGAPVMPRVTPATRAPTAAVAAAARARRRGERWVIGPPCSTIIESTI